MPYANQGITKIITLLWITLHIPALAGNCPPWDQQAAVVNITRLTDAVADHDKRYFNQNAPVISDGEYDALVARLKHWQACFPTITIQNAPRQTESPRYTINHQARMGSLKKASSDREVKRFLQRLPAGDVLVQPKIDGIAVELVYKNGQLIQATTRGNGATGMDILHSVRQMPLIPKTLSHQGNDVPPDLVLHGELFARLDKTTPATVQQYASARHLVAGQLNRSEPDIEVIKAFEFFPWHWIDSPWPSDFQSITALVQKGFPLPLEYTHKVQSYPDIEQLLKHYANLSKPIFLLDGIVIKADRTALRSRSGGHDEIPAWAIAWKFAPKTATSEVQSVTFTIGRTGHITPVVHIEPVVVHNRTLSTVSLGNVWNLSAKDLAVGDQISIKLTGNAIPVFDQVLFRPDNRLLPELPDTHRYSPFTCLSMAPGCEQQFIARLVWLTGKQGLDLAAISKAIIRQWVQAGTVRTLVDLLQLEESTLKASGMHPQQIRQYLASIDRPKSLEQQLYALGIPGIGKQKVQQLAVCIDSLTGLLPEQLVDKCTGIGSQRIGDLQDYVNRIEVRELIEFLERRVPTQDPRA